MSGISDINNITLNSSDLTNDKNYLNSLEEGLVQIENFKELMLKMHLGFLIIDNNHFIKCINAMFCDIFGFKSGESFVNTDFNTIKKDILSKVKNRQILSDIFEKNFNTDARLYDLRLTLENGYSYEVDFITIKFNGVVTNNMLIFRDITEKFFMEQELKKNKDLLAENEDLSKVGAWEFNIVTGGMFWTEGVYRIHDFAVGSDVDYYHDSLACYSEEDGIKIEKLFNTCISEGTPYDTVFKITTIKNNKKWIRTKTRPIYENDQIVKVIGSVMDITEQHENELKLKETVKTRDKMLKIIAHDLKNPFNAIIGMLDLTINNIRHNDFNDIEEMTILIRNSARQNYSLLENLLNWANIQNNKIVFSPVEIIFSSVLDNILNIKKLNLEHKKLRAISRIKGDLKFSADEYMISIIVRNLISNAIKFSITGSDIIVTADEDSENIIISVEDSGVGIPQEKIKDLFYAGKSYSTQGTQNEKGTGLGLILCREFIEVHGGKIWVESVVNKGTVFTFTIPKKKNVEVTKITEINNYHN